MTRDRLRDADDDAETLLRFDYFADNIFARLLIHHHHHYHSPRLNTSLTFYADMPRDGVLLLR